MKQLSRPQWIAVGVAAAVLAASAVAFAGMGGDGSRVAGPQSQPGLEEAGAVAAALAQLAENPADLVAADVRSALAGRARQALEPDATVSANAASWQPDGLGGGTMTVTVTNPGRPATVYTAIVVKEESGWKVLGTVPMNPGSAGTAPALPGQAPAAIPPNVAVPTASAPPAGQQPEDQPGEKKGKKKKKKGSKKERRR